jgi:hypothetical protein
MESRTIERQIFTSHTALSLEDDRNHPSILASPPKSERTLTKHALLPVGDSELRARVRWGHVSSQHFALSFDADMFHPNETKTLLATLESRYHQVFSLCHETFNDRMIVYAVDLRSPSLLGRTARTHFNLAERTIYLVRSNTESFDTELTQALVHAMRFGRCIKHYGITAGWAMLEDAFAVFISERLRENHKVFPFFGAEPNLIIHFLLERSAVRLLSYLWESKQFASPTERYVLAGAFLLYLGDALGDDKIIAFSRIDDAVFSGTFRDFFGESLVKLEERWFEHLPRTLVSFTEDERTSALNEWLQTSAGKF